MSAAPGRDPELPTKDDVRLYTLEEARELLPEVAERIRGLREVIDRLRFARGQVEDLRERWSETIQTEGTPLKEEYDRLRAQAATCQTDVDEHLHWFQDKGIEIKDPILGLVDFYAEGPEGELVYLCWQEGEEDVVAWHTLMGGFAARRPVEEL